MQQHHQQLALVYKNHRGSTIILSKTYPYLTSLSMATNPNGWLQPLMFLAYPAMYHITLYSIHQLIYQYQIHISS